MKASDSEKPESTPAPVETLQVVRGNNGTLFEVKKGVRGRQEILLSQETGYDLPEGWAPQGGHVVQANDPNVIAG